MTTPEDADQTAPSTTPDGGSPAPRQRVRLLAVLAVLAVVAGGAVAVVQLRGSDSDPAPSASATPSPTPSETETPEPDGDPDPTETTPAEISFAGTPTLAWTISPADHGPADTTEVRPADANVLGVVNTADALAVLVTGEDLAPTVLGVDRTTGAELWRTGLTPGTEARCFVVDDGSTVACWSYEVTSAVVPMVVLDVASGEVLGRADLGYRALFMVEDEVGLLAVGTLDGSILADNLDTHRPATVWTATTPDLVPPTEAWGTMTAGAGQVSIFLSGASAVLDRGTGEVLRTSGDSALLLEDGPALESGGYLMDVRTGASTISVASSADRVLAGGVGAAWTFSGPRSAPLPTIGIGAQAFDPVTGAATWSVEAEDPDDLRGTVVGDLLVLTSALGAAPVVGLDAATGTPRWTSDVPSAPVAEHGGVVMVGSQSTVVGVDPHDGSTLWTVDHAPALRETSSPQTSYQTVGSSLVTATAAGVVTGYTVG